MSTTAEAKEKVLSILTDGMDLHPRLGKNNSIQVGFSDSSTVVNLSFDTQEFDGKAPAQTFVYLTAPMLRNLQPTPELFKWVAIQGTGFRLGCVEAFEEEGDTIYLRYKYVLLADYLDEDELSTALWAVIYTADELDDELQKQFGGKRYIDED